MCAVKLVHQGSFTGRYRSYGTYKGVRNGSYRGEYAQNVPQKPSTALRLTVIAPKAAPQLREEP